MTQVRVPFDPRGKFRNKTFMSSFQSMLHDLALNRDNQLKVLDEWTRDLGRIEKQMRDDMSDLRKFRLSISLMRDELETGKEGQHERSRN